MKNKRDQTRSNEIDKSVMVGFFKSLPCALMCCFQQRHFVACDVDGV